MCFFDSPTARCEAVHELVLTDETQTECAREHACPPNRICPLCGYFSEGVGKLEFVPCPPGLHRSAPSMRAA